MDEVPEEDQQEISLDSARDPEAPEADVREQSEVVEPRQLIDPISTDPEVSEADALEQAEIVIGPEPGEPL